MKKIWTQQTIAQEAKKYNTRKGFATHKPGAYYAALDMGIMDEICTHMTVLRIAWTMEKIQKEALKYTSRKQFQVGSRAAYQYAFAHRLLNKICSHMPKDLKIGGCPPNKKWNLETISTEAMKYQTRSTFKQGSEGAYDAAKDAKLLDIVCRHMRISRNSSSYENELAKIIRSIYPSATKIRDRNVNIANKPYIKGFDVDIFIPELNKGIEMDGEYWHSFDVMWPGKSKYGWSKEDVLNYHKIKDEYFISKGIRLLHILDREWLDSKEQSLSKVLSFLREL